MQERPHHGELLKILGISFGLAVIIGNIIGSGILRTPGEVAAKLPNPWLFIGVWIAGGLYALLGALSVAELGAMIPRSGGQYVYAHRALGTYAGFIVGWSDWISTCGTSAAVAIIITEYTGVLLSASAWLNSLIASAIIISFALLHWSGVLWGSRAQEVTSLLKVTAFLVLVVSCFILGGKTENSASVPLPTGVSLFAALIIAMQSVI